MNIFMAQKQIALSHQALRSCSVYSSFQQMKCNREKKHTYGEAADITFLEHKQMLYIGALFCCV